MFCYYLYGKHVVINVELPLLCNIADYNKVDLTVHVDFDIITGETINIKKDYERYIIELGSLAYYCVDPTKNIIICKAANFESFFSTFFNIPFSVYFLCKDEILYHACSLIYDNKVFCLTITKSFGEFIGLKNTAYIDTNNYPFITQLLELGIAEDTGLTKHSAFCNYPLWIFQEGLLKSLGESEYGIYSEKYDKFMFAFADA